MTGSSPGDIPAACWLVLTPSVDRETWIEAISRGAEAIGWSMSLDDGSAGAQNPGTRLMVTDDALRAQQSGAASIAAIIAEPESAPEALVRAAGIPMPDALWQSSLLIARALSLPAQHQVITALELSGMSHEVTLFGCLRVRRPPSKAEFSREPALSNALTFYRHRNLGPNERVEWSEAIFTYCPRAAGKLAGAAVIETTGKPRILVRGPYIALPQGKWRAKVHFGVDDDAAKHQFRLDWGTRTETVSEHVIPGEPGFYEFSTEFVWATPDAAELRIILLEGSFSGVLLFSGLSLSRLPDPDIAVELR